MAETVVNLLIKNLVSLLITEGKILLDVQKDIQEIMTELECIQAFLSDADARAEKGEVNDVARCWVNQVRNQAYHIEDVIDEYIIHVSKSQHRNRLARIIRIVPASITKLRTRYDIAYVIKDIKRAIRETYNTSVRYQFKSSSQGADANQRTLTSQDHRLVSSFIEERELVGIEKPRDDLIKWFQKPAPNRAVISLVGMGGIGKTTLAKKVYDNLTGIDTQFHCHAWVTLSPQYHKEELLRRMIYQFYESRKGAAPITVNTMDLSSLIRTITSYLKMRRYVILLDDVWQSDIWSFIRNVLPNNKGSKIIITTQSHKVASSCKESEFDHIYQLQSLHEEKAWELFRKKAFQSEYGGHCPPDLEQCSRAIVGRCEGLPLAIVTLGRLLSTKQMIISEWRTFRDNLGTELRTSPELTHVTKIIFLGYTDLPDYLKPCFLYFGLLPGDFFINCRRLIKLWIAEGFIQREGAKTMEMIGEEYLADLIQRNLVQVPMMNFLGKPKRCRVHHLIREVILLKSRDLNFSQYLTRDDSDVDRKTRRLSLVDQGIKNISGEPLIRSVLLFKSGNLPNDFLKRICSTFKLLKVLDLQYSLLESLPNEVGDLLNLRYLSVRGTKIESLPKSIGNLYNLQVVDLKFTRIKELPVEIKYLHKLVYLLSRFDHNGLGPPFDTTRGMRMHNGVGLLKALHKLYTLDANHDGEVIIELGNLRQLRKLGITKLTSANCRYLCSSIEKMIHLRSLNICSDHESNSIDLSHILLPPPSIERINLRGRINRLPAWIPRLSELLILSLGWSGLKDDPLQLLQQLKNLRKLWFRQAYEGKQLHFKKGWFPALKVLGLAHLLQLEVLTIDEGAAPNLGELTIGPSPLVKEVPYGIRHLRGLNALRFFDMPREFVLRMPRGRPDYTIVENIPLVAFNRTKRVGCITYTLSDARDSYI